MRRLYDKKGGCNIFPLIYRHCAIRYFAWPIFRLENSKNLHYLQQQDPLDLHWTSGTAEKPQPTKLGGLWFKSILRRLSALLFVHLVCVSALSRSIYCRVYRVQKLEKIINKMLINFWILQLVIAGKRLC